MTRVGFPRTVGVDLDPVVVGVSEVDRLAHDVIGEARDLNAVANDVGEEPAEARAVGYEQRDVEEAGVALSRRRARFLDETHKRLVDAELGCSVLVREDAQADGVLPVRERAVEVGDA